MTPCDGRAGLGDAPTMAIRLRRPSSRAGSSPSSRADRPRAFLGVEQVASAIVRSTVTRSIVA